MTDTAVKITTDNPKLITVVPFPGTYGSWFDLDEVTPDPDMSEKQIEAFWESFDFSAWINELAKEYTSLYSAELSDILQDRYDTSGEYPDLLVFESVTSPRQYNFSTDTIYAYIKPKFVELLYSYATKNTDLLQHVITERLTPYPGFSPSYSNRIEDWLDRNPLEFDHNEIETLILVLLLDPNGGDLAEQTPQSDIEDTILEYIYCNTDLLTVG
ncbi:MAG: hypothetical protein HC800_25520 [Phormidesmis sp. RL_2_1]|nr:hypothetical protein [Phormidesmis sp. RL_2_1]